ncbi:MAG: ATP-binding protein, partial [Streptococcaceae bacterium]|jgi:hypothetical protein|nr:ATP-binding protein [Streptococcaceae bacterium]
LLQRQLDEAGLLVDDIVMKNYLLKLTDLEVVPLDDNLKDIGNIRLFKISEMVYQKDEYSTYKFASVFNSVQNLNSGVFIIADSNGKRTEFYMGVRSHDEKRTTKSLKDTLRNALVGQFPGVKTEDLLDPDAQEFLDDIDSKNIVAVSGIAKNKDEEFTSNEQFIQGLEKLVLAMQGKRYTAIMLAKSTPIEQLIEIRRAYENIYTQLSPFATTQISYGTNSSSSITDTFGYGKSSGTTYTTNVTDTSGTSKITNESVSKDNTLSRVMGALGAIGGSAAAAIGTSATIASGGTATPLTAPVIALGTAAAGAGLVAAFTKKTITKGTSETENVSHSVSISNGESETSNENYSYSKGLTAGGSDNMQLTVQNKTLLNTLERIDLQLKRIDEFESIGMWESAAYFLSDNQETAEMAAGTYRAIMKGENSGVETSAINFWGRRNTKQLPLLREYILNFMHPIFEYRSTETTIPVTASSLVSGNELAIQMGLPRKSVSGFPVIEHADFGKEIVKYNRNEGKSNLLIGNIFNMGSKTEAEVRIDRDSLAMHTFITGSTGSGKTNTISQILYKAREQNIRFLVIEPAKGEYKDSFGGYEDVTVYGTNPYKFPNMLYVNPFSFPEDIHVLEHIDRLVEVFNACWPMYAAMPAILKESVERSYEEVGWNLKTSKNPGEFPTFETLLEMLPEVIDSSAYSADTSSDYKGALVTRVRSLTRGIHGQIFSKDISNEKLFNENVIVDISRIGSNETKSLIMGILVLKLQEFRMSEDKFNSPLQHITVLEEAHNLLRKTSSEQSQESSNLQGKSVEMLATAIAEMRTYGEGFIIADQSPGLLDLSVIRNTNTKMIMRLPDENDRMLVGKAAALNDLQIAELAKLEKGVAAVYQSDWLEPVLSKIDKFENAKPMPKFENAEFDFEDPEQILAQKYLGVVFGSRKFELIKDEVDNIRKWYKKLQVSENARDIIEYSLAGYQLPPEMKLRLLVDLLGRKFDEVHNRKEAISLVNLVLLRKFGIESNDEITRNAVELLEFLPVDAYNDNEDVSELADNLRGELR